MSRDYNQWKADSRKPVRFSELAVGKWFRYAQQGALDHSSFHKVSATQFSVIGLGVTQLPGDELRVNGFGLPCVWRVMQGNPLVIEVQA
jgi:hypothetical protein